MNERATNEVADADDDALELERFEEVADQLMPEEWAELQDPDERALVDAVHRVSAEQGVTMEEAWRQLNALAGRQI